MYTVLDYFDGPLVGVANLDGVPHAYSCIFSDDDDAWTRDYALSPISDEQLHLVQRDWTRWKSWKTAFVNKTLGPEDVHPVLAVDQEGYERDRPDIAAAMAIDPTKEVLRSARFRRLSDVPVDDWEVCWSAPTQDA